MFHYYVTSLESQHRHEEAERRNLRARRIEQAKANGTYAQTSVFDTISRFLTRFGRRQPVLQPVTQVSPVRSTQS